jgi:hypothetical protein
MNARLGLALIAVLAMVALGAITALRHDPAEDRRAHDALSPVRPSTQALAQTPSPLHEPDLVGKEPQEDAALRAHVERKYRFLLADLRPEPASLDKLRLSLLERESIAQDSRDRLRLAQLDDAIRALLRPLDYAHYVALKDSDMEQQQLADYMGGISNVAPLTQSQERAVLEAKLRQKQRYATVLRDSGLERDTLSDVEREYAHALLADGLRQYRDDFLVDVAAVLTPDQHTLLSAYETTEFTSELERLQRTINAK